MVLVFFSFLLVLLFLFVKVSVLVFLCEGQQRHHQLLVGGAVVPPPPVVQHYSQHLVGGLADQLLSLLPSSFFVSPASTCQLQF